MIMRLADETIPEAEDRADVRTRYEHMVEVAVRLDSGAIDRRSWVAPA